MSHAADDGRVQVLVAPASPEDRQHEVARRSDIVEGFAEVLGASAVAGCRYESTARQIRHDKPELVLLVGSCVSDRCDYAGLRKTCDQCDARLAVWMHYDPYEFDAHVKVASLADFIFSNDRWAAMHYLRSAVWHLPLAASPRRFGQIALRPWADRTRDVYFSGTGYPNRQQMLADLAPTLQRCRTEICGSGWNAERLPFCRNQDAEPADLLSAYAGARIVLNMGRNLSPANDRFQLDPSTPGVRTFEAAMAGSCQMIFADSLEVMDYFEVGKEILLFNNADDFRAQLQSLLADGDRACSLGAAARRRAMREHTYAARARTLLEYIGLQSPTHKFAGMRAAA
jgi:spore maturation protein CgeB